LKAWEGRPMTRQAEITRWGDKLDALVARLATRFVRSEPRRRAAAYLRGLLAPVERKNGWQLAEAAGDRTPDAVQDFLSRMRWDADAVRDDLQAYAVEQFGDAEAVLVLDETGFVKKGIKSAGVGRQYSGTAGRIENVQVGVFLGYASRHGRVLIDRALYLPKDWAGDEARRAEARIPAEVAFTTKPKLGLAMLERARVAGVPFAWVAGDSVYGADHAIRRWAERHRRGYVLTVTSGQRLGFRPVTAWIADLPADAWRRLSAGDGAKGPRLYDWAYVPYRGGAEGFRCGLLVRRSLDDPDEPTFYLTHAPESITLPDLVRVAGMRWTVESLFEQAKGEVGLDHYEVRSWIGWHRHITLSMLALAYLAAVRKDANGGRGPDQPRREPAAAHGPGGSAPAAPPRRRTTTRPSRAVALVRVATATPATRPSRPLAAADNDRHP
jgi:SRSO17 transposase